MFYELPFLQYLPLDFDPLHYFCWKQQQDPNMKHIFGKGAAELVLTFLQQRYQIPTLP